MVARLRLIHTSPSHVRDLAHSGLSAVTLVISVSGAGTEHAFSCSEKMTSSKEKMATTDERRTLQKWQPLIISL